MKTPILSLFIATFMMAVVSFPICAGEWMSLVDIQNAIGYTTKENGTIVLSAEREAYTFDKIRVDYSMTSSASSCYLTIDYADTKSTALEIAINNISGYYINEDRNSYTDIATLKANGTLIGESVYEYDLNAICNTNDKMFYARLWQKNFLPGQIEAYVSSEYNSDCVVASGRCGDYLLWQLSCDSVLTISGVGGMWESMWDSVGNLSPWNDYNSQIAAFAIGDGVTYLNEESFNHGVQTIRFNGTINQWLDKQWNPSQIAYKYDLYVNGTKLTDLVIPNGLTRIKENVFNGCVSIQSVNVPESLSEWEDNAFNNCDSLKAVYITNLEKWCEIKCNAFSGNPLHAAKHLYLNNHEITGEIVIPNTLDSIGNWAFVNCAGITSVVIPEGIHAIGCGSFNTCKSITSVSLPNTLKSIGFASFLGCESLQELSIPDSVEIVNQYAFRNCYNLESVTMGNGLKEIGDWSFSDCHKLRTVNYGDNLQRIGSIAFGYDSLLMTIDIPSSVTYIGEVAFNNCIGLTSITCHALVPPELGDNVFYNVDKSIPLYVPSASINQYRSVLQWNEFLDIRSIPNETCLLASGTCGTQGNNVVWRISCDSILTIAGNGEMADYDYSSNPAPWNEYKNIIKSLLVEDGVTRIGNDAFHYCQYIDTVVLASSVEEIGEKAFYWCQRISYIRIPNSLKSIETNAFQGCLALTAITLPDSLTTIADYAFNNCLLLQHISIPDGVTRIGGNAFENCKALQSVRIPNSVTYIGNSAFRYCVKLQEVEVPEQVKTIGGKAFQHCVELKSVNLPNGIKRLEERVFAGCKGLRSIILPNTITSLEFGAFSNCDALISIQLPDSLTSIADGAFSGCSSLPTISIPHNVSNIIGTAFQNCTSLTAFYNHRTTPQNISSSVFSGINLSSCTLYVPASSIPLYNSAEVWKDFGYILPIAVDSISDDLPTSTMLHVTTILVDTTYQPMMVGGYIDEYDSATITRKGIIVSKHVEDMTIDNATTFESVNFNTALYTTPNTSGRYIDCTNIGQEEFIINLTLLEGNSKYFVRAFAMVQDSIYYGAIDSVYTQNFTRDISHKADYANVFENGSHTLFDLVTDEIINPQVGYYYSSNENPTVVDYRSGTNQYLFYKFLTQWNHRLWYYHNGEHVDRQKMVSLPQMSVANGLLTIRAADEDANKSLTIYYCVDGDGRRPENFTSIYTEPIAVQENSVVYCYAISDEQYISFTNAYKVINADNTPAIAAGIENNIDVKSTTRKELLNGQLFIALPDGRKYSATGMKVQ